MNMALESTSSTGPRARRIVAEVMIPGRGEPIEQATVCLNGNTITYAGPSADAPASGPEAGDDEVVTEVHTVMPGLWDCHVHFVGLPGIDLEMLGTTHPVTATARAASDVTATIRGGVTSVRDVGGLGLRMAPAVDEGRLLGPTIHAAGAILSTTGGPWRHPRLPARLRSRHQLLG